MKWGVGVALLVLGLALAAQAATTQEPLTPGEDVDRRKGPWFCHGRDCPRFKTVRGRQEAGRWGQAS
jgi:hypothetical protein